MRRSCCCVLLLFLLLLFFGRNTGHGRIDCRISYVIMMRMMMICRHFFVQVVVHPRIYRSISVVIILRKSSILLLHFLWGCMILILILIIILICTVIPLLILSNTTFLIRIYIGVLAIIVIRFRIFISYNHSL